MNYVICLLFIGATLGIGGMANSTDCRWERDIHHPYEDMHFPDTHVSYWRYRVSIPKDAALKLKIEGEFPHARYMALNAYDQRDGNQTSALTDHQIEPDANQVNPFREGQLRETRARKYTVWAVSRGLTPSAQNVLILPAATSEKEGLVDIWYRVYLPDSGFDFRGGVELPRITAIDAQSGAEVPCPTVYSPRSIPAAPAGPPPPNRGQDIRFYQTVAESDYGNSDNSYGLASLDFGPNRDVAVVTFKAPSFVDTFEQSTGAFPGGKNVRYWSMCLGGFSGEVTTCLADMDAAIDEDGNVTIVVAPESLQSAVSERGHNFLPRGKTFLPVLIYRNLLSGHFGMSMKGEYAPRGRFYSQSAFRSSFELKALPPGKGLSRHQIPFTPQQAPIPQPPVFRLGISAGFFIGDFWQDGVLGQGKDRDAVARKMNLFGTLFDDTFFEKTGLHAQVLVATSDIISRKLEEGSLDFGLILGEEYPWIERFYPELEPVVYGHSSKPLETQLVVPKAWFDQQGVAIGLGRLEDLKGLRLSVGPLRGWNMFALYRAILDLGQSPEGFFRRPEVLSVTYGSAAAQTLPAMLHNLVGRDFIPIADVALTDGDFLDFYAYMYGGVHHRMKVFKTLTTSPGATMIYHPGKVQVAIEDILETFIITPDTRPDPAAKATSKHHFGFDELRPIDTQYGSAMESYSQILNTYPEYFLPVRFMEAPATWKALQ